MNHLHIVRKIENKLLKEDPRLNCMVLVYKTYTSCVPNPSREFRSKFITKSRGGSRYYSYIRILKKEK